MNYKSHPSLLKIIQDYLVFLKHNNVKYITIASTLSVGAPTLSRFIRHTQYSDPLVTNFINYINENDTMLGHSCVNIRNSIENQINELSKSKIEQVKVEEQKEKKDFHEENITEEHDSIDEIMNKLSILRLDKANEDEKIMNLTKELEEIYLKNLYVLLKKKYE